MTAADLVAHLSGAKRRGDWFDALCPAHDDHKASFYFRDGDRGLIVGCRAGCTTKQIAAALGVPVSGLFYRSRTGRRERGQGQRGSRIPPRATATAQPPPGCTLAQYAAAKRLPIDFLRALGLRDVSYLGAPAVRIPYLDAEGTEVAVRFRVGLAKVEHGDDRFRWRRGDKPTLYGLWHLEHARAAGSLVLVEGESDAHTLWLHQISAAGIPGSASWRETWAGDLDGIMTIYVVIEPDRGGQVVREWLAESRIRDRVRLVTLGEAKDPSSLYLANPEGFRERWRAACEAAVPWSEHAAASARTQQQAAWRRCADLARDPDILARLEQDLRRQGLIGEGRAAKLLYLLVTSRLLDRPVSAVIKGPSSAGKSFVADRILIFLPATAYYALSAMSERALAYSQEPLAHRILVIYEAAGLNSDFASYLVRSLLSEGRVRYETVEKTKEGLRPRLIEREGPTGLLLTTTRVRLHEENETRLLSIPVTDTPDQTKAVLRQLARRRHSNRRAEAVNLERWHALQEWLATAEHRVVIPFAETLADCIPPVAVRLRRDFGTVLTLIEALAVLHQASRERDAEGAIVATLEDYAVVRELIADLIADGVEATVPETIRQIVEVVKDLGSDRPAGVTVTAVAAKSKLDKSTAWRRVQQALDRDYLENLEERKGRPARLRVGDPLPEEQRILPPATDPRLQGCTVAPDSQGVDRPPSPGIPERVAATVSGGWDEV